MGPKVYFPHLDVDGEEYQILTTHLDSNVELVVGSTIPPEADYSILIEGRPSRENLTASANLSTLIIPWAGLPNSTGEIMREFPHIAVHNIHHNAVITAEMMMALLLAAAKFVVPIDRAFREHGDWTVRYTDNPAVVLEGKTALVLGYGAIGQQVAKMCKGFGMHVIATRRQRDKPDDVAEEVYQADALQELLPRANVLMICLPLTKETKGLLGSKELALLPPQSLLVNGGRGPIVDEEAFYNALRDGILYAAGSDVWYHYPQDDEASYTNTPPSDFPFHELDNLVMSPHRGGGSLETPARRMMALADMLNMATQGQVLPHRIDLDQGY